MRPADIYGHEDRLLSFYASMRFFPLHLVPVLDRGNHTHKLPVYVSGTCIIPPFSDPLQETVFTCDDIIQVGDVAQGVVNIIADSSTAARTYEFVG